MAKNQSKRNPHGCCKQLYKATVSAIHRISHGDKNPPDPPLAAIVDPSAKVHTIHTQPAVALQKPTPGVEIPVEFDPHPPQSKASPMERILRLDAKGRDKHMGKSSFSSDDKFSNYVDRVKKKMMAASSFARGKSFLKRDSFNDRVLSYINRAKMKLRTTSGIGSSNRD